jgi:hypothetical protein
VVCALGKQASCCEESYGNWNIHNIEIDFKEKCGNAVGLY